MQATGILAILFSRRMLLVTSTTPTSTSNIPGFTGRDVDFCFGFRLNSCPSPASVDIYLQVPEKSVTFVHNMKRSDNVQVPGLTYRLAGNIVKADVFLDVTMTTPGSNRIYFGVDVTVRADYTLSQAWPEGLKRSLVPRQFLKLRSCSTGTPTYPQPLTVGGCIPMGSSSTYAPPRTSGKPHTQIPGKPTSPPATVSSTPATTTPTTPAPGTTVKQTTQKPGKSVKPTSPAVAVSTTPAAAVSSTPAAAVSSTPAATVPTTPAPGSHKKCNPEALYACGSSEVCSNGICVCLREKVESGGTCSGLPTQAPVATDSKNSNTTVIAASVVGSIVGLILLAAAVFLIARWRRARSQYANHELLLNNDDNMVM